MKKNGGKIQTKKPVIYLALNPETLKMEQVYPESEIPQNELIYPMFWADGPHGGMYVSVPGTEFYGPVPEN